jgi:histidinol-phosphate/aromatic aminotransferase/cobyric acid decarboxylase-like protein
VTNRHYTAGLPVRLYESESSVETVAAAHGLDPADVVDFSLNVNPYGPPTSAVAPEPYSA